MLDAAQGIPRQSNGGAGRGAPSFRLYQEPFANRAALPLFYVERYR